jgi:hypothetical protein
VFSIFKKKPTIPEVLVLSKERSSSLELEKAKLPENLAQARAKFNGSQIDNKELILEPSVYECYNDEVKLCYNVSYRGRGLGRLFLDHTDVSGFLTVARQNFPELYPVNGGELYNVYTNHYGPYDTSYKTARIIQVVEIYLDSKTQLPIYMVKDIITEAKETISHECFAYDSVRVKKIG